MIKILTPDGEVEVETSTDAERLIQDFIVMKGQLPRRPLRMSTFNGILGIHDLLGTDNANDERAVEFDERIGRCYELAAFALIQGDASERAHLIHGSIHGPDPDNVRMGHAWLVHTTPRGRLVWDPTMALWYRYSDWYKAARARDEREYTKGQVERLVLSNMNYGRWHDSRYP